MPTADEVIVEFEARVGKYEADLRRSAATFERVTKAQQRQMEALERQVSASTGVMANAFKGLAALFGASQVMKLSDDYTRLQNSLKVAGLEGENLLKVQGQLLDLGGEYGVSVNTLADLYGNLSQVGKELGASQAQILTINKEVAQSLIVTGKSSAEASGAVLGLVQAFGNGKLQAEEWAQINEGGLRPLLEAAAASEKYGGSVQKLRAAVYDGKVTSQEFFQAILAGAQVIEGKASTATLTLEGAFTALNNRLIEFVGGAASTSGAAGAIASGLQALANNLDTVSKSLAVIAAVLGVKYLSALVGSAVSTIALSAANVRLTLTTEALASATYQANVALLGEASAARIATASVTNLAVAQGVAARAGAGLLAVIGGPLGAAVLALGAAIVYLGSKTAEADQRVADLARTTEEAAAKADLFESRLGHATSAIEGTGRAALIATGKVKTLADALTIAASNAAHATQTLIALETVELRKERGRLDRQEKQIEGERRTRSYSTVAYTPGGGGGVAARPSTSGDYTAQDKASLDLINQQRAQLDRQERALQEASRKGIDIVSDRPGPSAPTEDDPKKKAKTRATKPPVDNTERDLARLRLEELQARLDLATTAEARAELQDQILAEEKAQRIKEAKGNKEAIAAIERLYGPDAPDSGDITVSRGLLQRKVDLDKATEQAREAADLADEQFRAQQEVLRNQYDLADSSAERKRLALASIELEDRYQRAQLQAIIDLEGANSAAGKRAQVALDAQAEITSGRKAIATRSNQSPLEAYRDRLDRDAGETKDLVESYVVDELNSVRDSISGAIQKRLGVKDPLIAGLLNMFIEDVIMKPLAEALKGAGSGGGGFLGSLVNFGKSFIGSGSTPGRAIGGPVTAGRAYKVGESGEEMFVPQQNGVIVPNHRLKGNSGGNTIISAPQFNLNAPVVTAELYADMQRISDQSATRAAGASFAQGQRSVPPTLSKYNQLKG
ncbi:MULTISPECIES: tape measure protein [unclassified Novosphingobium]|uniref:tape measure protein n=1 Tax=unclassified Novosphingobium TaxID=2644732 RepID=UPI00135C0264|nr:MULTISPECIES: tape measure protein [unclassified Novosphingobium]